MSSPAPATVISLVTIVGLIVLIALGKVTYAEGGPAILLLAGVHTGAILSASPAGPGAPQQSPAIVRNPAQTAPQAPQTSKLETGAE